jgi:hypothetical protein
MFNHYRYKLDYPSFLLAHNANFDHLVHFFTLSHQKLCRSWQATVFIARICACFQGKSSDFPLSELKKRRKSGAQGRLSPGLSLECAQLPKTGSQAVFALILGVSLN